MQEELSKVSCVFLIPPLTNRTKETFLFLRFFQGCSLLTVRYRNRNEGRVGYFSMVVAALLSLVTFAVMWGIGVPISGWISYADQRGRFLAGRFTG
jgi:hypothetical protein